MISAVKVSLVLAGESVMTRGAALSYSGVRKDRAISVLNSDLVMCKFLY